MRSRLSPRRGAVVAAAILAAAACGESAPGAGGPASTRPEPLAPSPVVVAVAQRESPRADLTVAGRAVTAMGDQVFVRARAGMAAQNVTLSPLSIAIALAMVEPGAVDPARTELRDLLHITDSAAYHDSMNALERDLETRRPVAADHGDQTVRIANSAYLDAGSVFVPAYLDAVGASYGPVVNTVDFSPDPDAVAHVINEAVEAETDGRIVDLIGDGVLHPDTAFVLVNALYLAASWTDPFDPQATADAPFTTASGTTVTVPMMSGTGTSSARGDGWVGATKSLGNGLVMQFVLPDAGRFDGVADRISGVWEEYSRNAAGGAPLAVPRFETRLSVELDAILRALGLEAPYRPGGLTGMTGDESLVIDKVVHQTFVAVDEQGVEAAAATAVIGITTSAPVNPPVPVRLDRPFLYRILDLRSQATLFVGQVMDPTA